MQWRNGLKPAQGGDDFAKRDGGGGEGGGAASLTFPPAVGRSVGHIPHPGSAEEPRKLARPPLVLPILHNTEQILVNVEM